jgi:hypothetical protein
MALTQDKIIDSIEIIGKFKHIQVREKKRVFEDSKEISSSFHRYTLSPDSDNTNQPQEIQDIANIVWTKEVKASWKAHLKG